MGGSAIAASAASSSQTGWKGRPASYTPTSITCPPLLLRPQQQQQHPQGRKMHAETHSHTRRNCEKARASEQQKHQNAAEQQKHQNAVEVIDCGVATQGPPLQVLRTLRAQDGPSLSMGEQLYRIPQLQVFYALLLLRNHDVILRGAYSLHRLC